MQSVAATIIWKQPYQQQTQNRGSTSKQDNRRRQMSSAASQVKKSKDLLKEIHDPTSKHQVINIEVEGNKALALIDPQTTGGNLISTNYASVYNLPLIQTLEPIQVNLALKGSKGVSTHYVRMKIKIGSHE